MVRKASEVDWKLHPPAEGWIDSFLVLGTGESAGRVTKQRAPSMVAVALPSPCRMATALGVCTHRLVQSSQQTHRKEVVYGKPPSYLTGSLGTVELVSKGGKTPSQAAVAHNLDCGLMPPFHSQIL